MQLAELHESPKLGAPEISYSELAPIPPDPDSSTRYPWVTRDAHGM